MGWSTRRGPDRGGHGAGRLAPGSPEFERFIDITARRPSGEAVQRYRDPTEHYADFETALCLLELAGDDRYLELCFGGW